MTVLLRKHSAQLARNRVNKKILNSRQVLALGVQEDMPTRAAQTAGMHQKQRETHALNDKAEAGNDCNRSAFFPVAIVTALVAAAGAKTLVGRLSKREEKGEDNMVSTVDGGKSSTQSNHNAAQDTSVGDANPETNPTQRKLWYTHLPVIYALRMREADGASGLLELDLEPTDDGTDPYAVAFEKREDAERAVLLLWRNSNIAAGVQAAAPSALERKAREGGAKLAVLAEGEVLPEPTWSIDEFANAICEVCAPENMVAFIQRQLEEQEAADDYSDGGERKQSHKSDTADRRR